LVYYKENLSRCTFTQTSNSVQLVQSDSHEHHKAEATTGLYSTLLQKD